MTTAVPEPAVLFHEIQRPRWTLATAALAAFIALALVLPPLFNRPPSVFGYFQGLVLLLALASSLSRLRTLVEGHTLELERRWGGRLTVDLERVRFVREAPYYPRIDGGWGVRSGRGVILTYADGNVLYVGSARADELCEVIRGMLPAASAA